MLMIIQFEANTQIFHIIVYSLVSLFTHCNFYKTSSDESFEVVRTCFFFFLSVPFNRFLHSFIFILSVRSIFYDILLCLLCYNCHFHSNPYKQTAIPKILIFTDLNSLQHVLKWIDYALPTSRVRTKHHNNEGNRQVSRLGQGGNYSRTQHKKQKIT